MKIDIATMLQILAMFKIVCHVTITHGQVYLNGCRR